MCTTGRKEITVLGWTSHLIAKAQLAPWLCYLSHCGGLFRFGKSLLGMQRLATYNADKLAAQHSAASFSGWKLLHHLQKWLV